MPIPISPLEDLAEKVDKDAAAVTPAMVEAAFTKEKEAIEKKYDELKEQGDKAERASYLERLDALKSRLLFELSLKREARESGRGRVLSEAMGLRKDFDEKMKERSIRHTAMKEARNKARVRAHMMTDPTSAGARIDDYEGWSAWGEKMEDENYNNETRWLLTGWVSAHDIYDEQLGNAEMNRAVDVYEKASGIGTVLEKGPMMKGLGMERYAGELSTYKLASEAVGFVGGYLSIADKQMPENSAGYRDYVNSVLQDLHRSGQLNPPVKAGDLALMYDFNRGEAQLNALSVLRSPKEWLATQEKMRLQFEDLAKLAESIKSGVGFSYVDARLKVFLDRPKESITFADEDDLLYARAKIREEAYPQLKKIHDDTDKVRKEVMAKYAEVVKKNEEGKEFSEEDLRKLKARLDSVESNLIGIIPLSTDSLEQIAKYSTPMGNIITELNVLKPKLEDMEKAAVAAVERRKREEEVEKERKEAEEKEEKKKKDDGAKGGGEGAGGGSGGAKTGGGSEGLKGSEEPLRSRFGAGAKLVLRLGAEAKYYDSEGKLLGELDDSAKMVLADDRAIKTIDGKIHAKVIYNGTDIWVKETDLEQMVDKDKYKQPEKELIKKTLDEYVSHEEKHAKTAKIMKGLADSSTVAVEAKNRLSGKSTVDVSSDVVNLLPNIEITLMYAKTLNLIAEYAKNVDIYPNGVDVQLPFNGIEVNCHVQYRFKNTGEVLFTPNLVPRETFVYRSMDSFARSLNGGFVHRQMTRKMLGERSYYKGYEGLVETLDFTDPMEVTSDNEYTHHLEFDWKGWTDDPDIYVRPLRHGRVEYKLQWRHVNHDGDKWRHGYAENFRDFMYKLRHYRDWALGYNKIDKGERGVAETRERRYELLSNPFQFRNNEDRIGRIIRFRAEDDYSVGMYLDWGGGNDLNSRGNAQVDMGVGVDGEIFYTVRMVGAERAILSGTSGTVSGVIRDLERMRGRKGIKGISRLDNKKVNIIGMDN